MASTSRCSVVTASATGRAHRVAHRGNQDAVASVTGADAWVLVVADGCSAGAHTELGAGVGARFVAAVCARAVAERLPLADIPAHAAAALHGELRRLLDGWCAAPSDAAPLLAETLLFTVQAAVVVRTSDGLSAVVFGVGDGVVRVDGAGPTLRAVGGAPDYPAYAFVAGLPAPRWHVHHHGPVRASVLVGTDGCEEIDARCAELLPSGEALGDLAFFADDARFVRNPSLAQKRLLAWQAAHGGAVDDATFALLRVAPLDGGAR